MTFLLDYKIAGDPQKFIDAINRALAKMEEMNQGGRRVGKTGAHTTKIFDGLFRKLAGFASIGSILGMASRGMADFQRMSQEALEVLKETENVRKRLAQIAESPADLRSLTAFAEAIGEEAGLTFAQAGELVFQAMSAGFTRPLIAQMSDLQRIMPDVTQSFRTVQQLQTQFGVTAGSAMEMMNMVLRAAKESPAGLEELGPEAAKAAAATKGLGGSIEELLGVAALGLRGGEFARQVTFIRAAFTELSGQAEFMGLGIVGALEKLKNKYTDINGLVDEQALALSFANIRARDGGMLLVRMLDEIKGIINAIREARAATGTPQAPVEQARRRAEADPYMVGLRQARQAEARYESTAKLGALRESTEQSILRESRTLLQQRYEAGEIGRVRFLRSRMALGLLDYLNLEPSTMAASAASILGQTWRAVLIGAPTERGVEDIAANRFVPYVGNYERARMLYGQQADDTGRELLDEVRGLREDRRADRGQVVIDAGAPE